MNLHPQRLSPLRHSNDLIFGTMILKRKLFRSLEPSFSLRFLILVLLVQLFQSSFENTEQRRRLSSLSDDCLDKMCQMLESAFTCDVCLHNPHFPDSRSLGL
jgi:hypothetical protein